MIEFLLGLAIGIGLFLWQRYMMDLKLKTILAYLPNNADEVSLSLVSSLRRSIMLAQEEKENLKLALQKWEKILENAPIGYLEIDEENQLIWCNNQAKDLLHIQKLEQGKIRLLLELVRSYELDQLIEKTRNLQELQEQEWLFYPSNGNLTEKARSLYLKAYSFPLDEGKIGVFLENQQPFIELVQSKEQLISDLSHELRTPLTSIKLVAETLQNRFDPQKEGKWIVKMLQEINRLINMVQDWLSLTQLTDDPRENLNFQQVEIKTVILLAWQSLEPLAKQKHLELHYTGEDELKIIADRDRLIQVFVNILHNSIKYSSEAQIIKVETKIYPQIDENTSLVAINIIDYGIGFQSNDLPHVFERLYRGDTSRAREIHTQNLSNQQTELFTSGSGLGLAIVKQIILAHRGNVIAKNHPQTGGGWLIVELPLQ